MKSVNGSLNRPIKYDLSSSLSVGGRSISDGVISVRMLHYEKQNLGKNCCNLTRVVQICRSSDPSAILTEAQTRPRAVYLIHSNEQLKIDQADEVQSARSHSFTSSRIR